MSGSIFSRVSQAIIEALERTPFANFVRVSQVVAAPVVASNTPAVRSSQATPEALAFSSAPPVRASQVVTEGLSFSSNAPVRASQGVVETLVLSNRFVRCSQAVLECLVVNKELPMPALFPNLIGLTWSTAKRPIFNTLMRQAASGRQVRIAMYEYPLWEWDLTWDSLPDGNSAAASSFPSDLKQIIGFYLAMQGSCFTFNYQDPDDNQVIGQAVGVGDGTTSAFTLFRTYGGSDGTGTEPIGMVNQTGPNLNGNGNFNVYFGGVLQPDDGSVYTVVTAVPLLQQIRFNSTPAEGTVITADFSFYYYVHFKDDQYDFDKIWSQMWSQKKITLASVRQ